MTANPPARPNVIWVFGDQHRAAALGCAGDPNLATPNLDRLAAEGWRSTAAVAGSPLCGPFRGSLLTSQYPHRCVPGNDTPLPDDARTIAHAFADAGYHTAYFGKWHVACAGAAPAPPSVQPPDAFSGPHRSAFATVPRRLRGGFHTRVGYDNNNAPFDTIVHGHDGDAEVTHTRLPGYETDVLTDRFITHLRARAAAGQPFFAALSVQPPHDPYVAPARWMRRHRPGRVVLRPNVPAVPRVVEQARTELAGYYAAIECLDHNLGRIRAALDTLGITDRTHIVFFSDHGDLHGSQGHFRKHAPWEEAVRIPFIIGGMGVYGLHRGAEPLLINHVDIAPTTLGLCGIDPPDWMCGTDFSGHRRRDRTRAQPPTAALLQYVEPTRWSKSTDRPWRGVVTADGWKYVCLEHQPWLLFNLNEDPYEQVNLALAPPWHAQRRALHQVLRDLLDSTGDAFALSSLD